MGLTPQDLRRFVKGTKNDFIYAEVICEAASREALDRLGAGGVSRGLLNCSTEAAQGPLPDSTRPRPPPQQKQTASNQA
jgi:hypothetical protein